MKDLDEFLGLFSFYNYLIMLRNTNTKLYHKDIYLPQDLINQAIYQQQNTTNFVFTKHLIERIECKDRSHNSVTAEKIWNVLSKLKEKPIIPFEVETENDGTSGLARALAENFDMYILD